MKDIFKIRHEIVKHLYSKITYSEIDVPKLTSTKTEIHELAKEIKRPFEEVFIAHHSLNHKEHIKCVDDTGNHSVVLLKDGINAVIDSYWLREGQKEVNERIYDKSKWIVPIVALIITATSLMYSVHKISQTEQKLKLLEKEILLLKERKTLTRLNYTFQIYHQLQISSYISIRQRTVLSDYLIG